MKILFVGDYSGMHATLAAQLRRMGHDCTVASGGSFCMNTDRDIDLRRKPGLLGSLGYMGKVFRVWPELKGYDVVMLINPNFLDLRPGKLRYFLRELKANNGKIGLSLAGPDPVIVKSQVEDGVLRYSEYMIGEEKSPYVKGTPGVLYRWLNGQMGDYCRFVYENIDFAASALYEYHIGAKPYLLDTPLTYMGIGIDTRDYDYHEFARKGDGRLNILVGIKSELELYKGTDRLLAAAMEVERRHPDKCRVTVARDLPLEQYMQKLNEADVVIDQLYSYTPATNALQAMAMGKIVVSGGEPEYYDFIGEKDLRPIVNVVPDDAAILAEIEKLVLAPDAELKRRSTEGRQLVEKHNDVPKVAHRFMAACAAAKK